MGRTATRPIRSHSSPVFPTGYPRTPTEIESIHTGGLRRDIVAPAGGLEPGHLTISCPGWPGCQLRHPPLRCPPDGPVQRTGRPIPRRRRSRCENALNCVTAMEVPAFPPPLARFFFGSRPLRRRYITRFRFFDEREPRLLQSGWSNSSPRLPKEWLWNSGPLRHGPQMGMRFRACLPPDALPRIRNWNASRHFAISHQQAPTWGPNHVATSSFGYGFSRLPVLDEPGPRNAIVVRGDIELRSGGAMPRHPQYIGPSLRRSSACQT